MSNWSKELVEQSLARVLINKRKLGEGWRRFFSNIIHTKKFKQLYSSLKKEINVCNTNETKIYPDICNVFNAFYLTQLSDIHVVIIGQDPYINEVKVANKRVPQATGLSFSVPDGVRYPPSLRNIFKELKSNLGIERTSGDLSDWASQGVFLINAAFTVRCGNSGSHAKMWRWFTNEVIKYINTNTHGVVWVLLGGFAQKKSKLINTTNHVILKTSHPSPLSANRGFLGSNIFSKINAVSKSKIDW